LRFTDEDDAWGAIPQSRTDRLVCAILFLLCALTPGPDHAWAEEKLPSTRNLDGLHLALGPVGSAIHLEGEWDSAFGLEVSGYRVRERSPLVALGMNVGGAWFSARSDGRMWVQADAASRVAGVVVGVSAGPAVQLDELRPPRWGAQAALWFYAGVVPYVRLGAFQDSGTSIEIGLRIPLPVLRWRAPL